MTDPIPPDVLDEGARLLERLVITEYDEADLAVTWFRHEGLALVAVARDHARLTAENERLWAVIDGLLGVEDTND